MNRNYQTFTRNCDIVSSANVEVGDNAFILAECIVFICIVYCIVHFVYVYLGGRLRIYL